MPRRLLEKLLPHPDALKNRWPVRLFGERIIDPQLWTLHRRAVTYGFGAGVAICFVPLPVHLLLAVLAALIWRLNIPVTYGATWIFTNPFTAVPVYYLAYRVGTLILGEPQRRFRFIADWHWLSHSLQPVWRPFAIGCLACGLVGGFLGWLTLELLWRGHVRHRYRRRQRARAA